MTAPVTAFQPVSTGSATDLSRLSQAMRAYEASEPQSVSGLGRFHSGGSAQMGTANATATELGHFSLEDIPLVGDFISMISSLFHPTSSGVSTASTSTQEHLAMPPSYRRSNDLAQSPQAPVAARDVAMDLTRFINLGIENARQSDAGQSIAGSQPFDRTNVDMDIDALQPALPSVSGLATHPSNKIPAATLELLQERYLKQFSQEG